MLSICQLFYVSRAHQAFDAALIQSILASSRRNNPPLEVTGCLLFSGAFFAQVLEGPEAAVQALARRIADDPRHHDVRVLLETHRLEREYGDWSMGYLHDTGLAATLERLAADDGYDPVAAADIMMRMKPDTVMGALA